LKYLLDTNILSETRRKAPAPQLLDWLDSVDQKDLFVSILTLGELTKGIELRRRSDPRAAASLEHWLQGLEKLFSSHIIGIDAEIAATWGKMNARRTFPVIDSLLAATARVHGLTLVTRNVGDIEDSGVARLNPWTAV